MKVSDKDKEKALEMASTGSPMVSICVAMGISVRQLYRYLNIDPIFKQELTDARNVHGYILEDELLSITRDCETFVEVKKAAIESENIKSVLAYRNPQRYGNKVDLTVNKGIDLSSVLIERDAKIIPLIELKRAASLSAKVLDTRANSVTAKVIDSVTTNDTASTMETVSSVQRDDSDPFDDLL